MTSESNGYIVTANDGMIYGFGDTADDAWDDAEQTMAAAGIVVLNDDEDSTEQLGNWCRASSLKILPATEALLQRVESDGADIRWTRTQDGVADIG